MGQRIALIIGNSHYDDPNLARLTAPDADVNALAAVLRHPDIGAFDEVTILVNEPATIIRRAIARFFAGKHPDDLLLLYFSGHGVLDDRGHLHFALKDTERNLLRGSAVEAAFVTDVMDTCRSRRQVLILDCCHSGAFARGTKGVVGASVGTSSAFEGTGYGRVVLTATDATQYAWEGDQVIGQAEKSLFTHHLVEGLRTGEADIAEDGEITIDELYNYVYGKVVNATSKQTPGKWSYRQQGDIAVAKNPYAIRPPLELPLDLRRALASPFAEIRAGAVEAMKNYLNEPHSDLAPLAQAALERLTKDDSATVAGAANRLLKDYTTQRAEMERVAREKIEQARVDRETQQIARGTVDRDQAEKGQLEAGTKHGEIKKTEEASVTEAKTGERDVAKVAPYPYAAGRPVQRRSRSKWLVVAIALSLIGMAAYALYIEVRGLGSCDNPAWSPDSRQIVFECRRDQTSEIYVMKADGSAQTRLTNNSALDETPIWSPDGQQIAFASDLDPAPIAYEIYTMKADGTSLKRLADNLPGSPALAWSPDGKQIAFVSGDDAFTHAEIYKMNADGTAQTRLTNNSVYDREPKWSPDSQQIAFVSRKDPNDSESDEIYVMNADGSGLRRLVNLSGAVTAPAWSPNGKQIAFGFGLSTKAEIYKINADGSALTQLTNNVRFDGRPVWSPDGQQIAFQAYALDRGGSITIYTVNADGSAETPLLPPNNQASLLSPKWSPDGKQIAYIANGHVHVIVMTAGNFTTRQLTK